jgi:hypothetical protein
MPILRFVRENDKGRRNSAGRLFSTYNLHATLAYQLGALEGEIDNFPTEYLLNVDDEKLHRYLETKYLVEYPRLDYTATKFSESTSKLDVSQDWRRDIYDRSRPFYVDASAVTLHVPIVGQSELFDASPNVIFMGSGGPPEGKVSGGEVRLVYSAEQISPEVIEKRFETDKNEIHRVLQYICRQIGEYNDAARARIQSRVAERRARISNLRSGLKFPLKARPEEEQSPAPVIERKLLPPKVYSEPALELRQYDEVLGAIQNAALAIERAPSAFARMTEEEIRHHFLIALNTVFSGGAGAETFNGSGKTDILIRVEGRTIFIAECKFWRGKKSFLQAIDQLLGYTSWRDSKTALVVLNRGRNLSGVLTQISGLVRQHPNYVRDESGKGETNLRFVMHHPDDAEREILMSVLLFEVPAKQGSGAQD